MRTNVILNCMLIIASVTLGVMASLTGEHLHGVTLTLLAYVVMMLTQVKKDGDVKNRF